MKRKSLGSILALAVVLAQAAPSWAAPATTKPAQAPPAAASPRPVDAAAARGLGDANPAQKVAQTLQQIHMTACAGTVQTVTSFLFEGQDANFIAQPLGPDSDRWPTVFVIESTNPTGGHNRFATLMIAPNCSGMYEQTIYWPEPCASVKTSVFAKFTGEHALLRDVKVSDAGPGLQVYLTPAGSGCVSVKKELFR